MSHYGTTYTIPSVGTATGHSRLQLTPKITKDMKVEIQTMLVLQIKTSKIINDMAKVQQKSEKISAFGGIFSFWTDLTVFFPYNIIWEHG